MTRLMVRATFVIFLLGTKSHAQSEATIPKAEDRVRSDAGHASQASCVILKRMGRLDRSKSRLYSLGIRGKQFRYVEGKLPEGFPFHGKMTDHDVRNLQARGAEVIVLESNYTSEDLKGARAGCAEGTATKSNQAELKASTPGTIASTPAAAPKVPAPNAPSPKTSDPAPSVGTDAALLDISCSQTEADVYVDERFSARTPSTLILMPGDYKIAVKKSGFVVWQRKFKLPSGHTSVYADLVPKAK